MVHNNTHIAAVDPLRRNDTVFQKTVAINDFYMRGPGGYPLGQIQSQGRTEAVTLKSETPWYGRPTSKEEPQVSVGAQAEGLASGWSVAIVS